MAVQTSVNSPRAVFMTKSTDPNVVSTRQAVALCLNIPLEHVKVAKELACPAAASTGRYYLKEFKEWYDLNLPSILEYLDDKGAAAKTNNEWKQRKERALALIAEIELREREFKTLDKDKTIARLKQILGSQAIILRNFAQDLPPRLLGKNVTEMGIILATAYDDVCNLFSESLDKWIPKK